MVPATQIINHLVATKRAKILRATSMIEDAADRLDMDDAKGLVESLCHRPGKTDKRRLFTPAQKKRVHARDHGVCYHCHKAVAIKDCHIDHIVPWSLGGKTADENGVCSCAACNEARGNKLVYEARN